MSVDLLVDLYSTRRSSDCIHVDGSHSFLEASRRIDISLEEGTDLCVVLHKNAQVHWFDHFKHRIHVKWYDPCVDLASRLGIEISQLPVELIQDPRFIISSGLLDKAHNLPFDSFESVDSWILNYSIDPIWAFETIDTYDKLSKVLLHLLARQPRKFCPVIQSIRNRRIALWINNSSFPNFFKWLFANDFQRRAESIVIAKLIWRYPHDIKTKALYFGNRWSDITLLEDFESIILNISGQYFLRTPIPLEVKTIISSFLEKKLMVDSLNSVVPILSGNIVEENVIMRFLENSFDSIDESWTESLLEINRIFSIKGQSSSFIEYIEQLVPIQKPDTISDTMSWDSVSNWLQNDFFPYYRWCAALGKLPFTAQSVDSFENWLQKNYYSLTKTPAYAPAYVLPRIRHLLKNSSVLHVVIDCMPWVYAEFLYNLFVDTGISTIETSMHLTTLPTITRIAKTSLIRGQLPGQLPPSTDQIVKTYPALFSKALSLDLGDIIYGNSSDTSIEKMVLNQKKAYLFLDNELDEICHKPLTSELRRTRIESHLKEICVGIISARERYLSCFGTELSVVISSDHGFTELPEDNCIMPISLLESSVDHSRILVPVAEFCPSRDHYIPISKEMLGGSEQLFYVARGYATIASRPKGATHGGMTPQEVVVPTIVIDAAIDSAFKSLNVALTGEIRRGRKSNTVSINFFNNNNYFVFVKLVDMRLITILEPQKFVVQPGKCYSLPASFDSSRVKDEILSLAGCLSCNFKSVEYTRDFVVDVPTVGAAIADQSFEDDFDV